MVCRKRPWHDINECEDSDVMLVRQFNKVRKLNSDLFNIHGVTPPAQTEIMNRNLSSSTFLRLPPEIRNRIYHFVFGGEQVYVSLSWEYPSTRDKELGYEHRGQRLYHSTSREHRGKRLDLRILRVCRQVFTEAALLPYKLNSFTFDNEEARNTFERVVRPGKKLAQKKAVGKYEIGFPRRVYPEEEAL